MTKGAITYDTGNIQSFVSGEAEVRLCGGTTCRGIAGSTEKPVRMHPIRAGPLSNFSVDNASKKLLAKPSKPYTAAQSVRNPLGTFGHLGTVPKPATGLNGTATHEFVPKARTDYNHLKSEGFENHAFPDEIHAVLFADFGKWRNQTLLNEQLQDVVDLLASVQVEDIEFEHGAFLPPLRTDGVVIATPDEVYFRPNQITIPDSILASIPTKVVKTIVKKFSSKYPTVHFKRIPKKQWDLIEKELVKLSPGKLFQVHHVIP